MKNINKVTLLGNLGRDPEVRETKTGIVASFSIATNESRKNESGEFDTIALWHRIIAFDKLAEIAEKYLKKGSKCLIEGKLRYGEYLNKEGIKVNTTDILANDIILLSHESESSDSQPQSNQSFNRDSGSSGRSNDNTASSNVNSVKTQSSNQPQPQSYSQPQTQRNYTNVRGQGNYNKSPPIIKNNPMDDDVPF